jgi:hypothetical protein
MDELRIRPSSNYLQEANWRELYLLTKHWKTDIKFANYEINFFKGLIDKYFIWVKDKDQIIQVQHLANILTHLTSELNNIDKTIIKHLNYIRLFINSNFSHDEEVFRVEHAILEDKIVGFANALRETKREIFNLTEEMLNNEKTNQLIDQL